MRRSASGARRLALRRLSSSGAVTGWTVYSRNSSGPRNSTYEGCGSVGLISPLPRRKRFLGKHLIIVAELHPVKTGVREATIADSQSRHAHREGVCTSREFLSRAAVDERVRVGLADRDVHGP